MSTIKHEVDLDSRPLACSCGQPIGRYPGPVPPELEANRRDLDLVNIGSHFGSVGQGLLSVVVRDDGHTVAALRGIRERVHAMEAVRDERIVAMPPAKDGSQTGLFVAAAITLVDGELVVRGSRDYENYSVRIAADETVPVMPRTTL
jgi:hypothetical protein